MEQEAFQIGTWNILSDNTMTGQEFIYLFIVVRDTKQYDQVHR